MSPTMKTRARAAFALAATVAAFTASAPAHAEYTVIPDSFSVTASDPAGGVSTQAGAHPDLKTSFAIKTRLNSRGNELPDGSMRDVVVDLPAGFSGDPTAVPYCDRADIDAAAPACPISSQVGMAHFSVRIMPGPFQLEVVVPVFNMRPPRGVTAQLGMRLFQNNVMLSVGPRTDGDYGLQTKIKDLPNGLLISVSDFLLWGVPADPSHDAFRGYGANCSFPLDPANCSGTPTGASIPKKAFLTNPAACTGSLTAKLATRAWEEPDRVLHVEDEMPAVTGCDKLRFGPTLSLTPDTKSADSPAGVAVDIDSPQNADAAGVGTPPLRDVRVTLPDGMTINPASAQGLAACTDAQLGLGTNDPITCPDASKIGTAVVDTPVLPEPLTGGVYIRPQASDDPESGNLFRAALVIKSEERGLIIKLAGSIKANRDTGKIEASFADNPQLPVSHIALKLKPGTRAPVATSPNCGGRQTLATLSSWGGQAVSLTDAFDLDCPGMSGFSPALAAGTSNPVAGQHAPLVVRAERADRQELMDGVTVDLPTGLLASLKGVAQCADSDASAGACPAAARVGSATVGAGAGGDPFQLVDQPVYLTGPYKGAPFGLAVVTRAIAGPFDLGTVVVRQAISIDPIDAHVSVVSDPLPTILKGVPLRLRSVQVSVDRPGFALNPTSARSRRFAAPSTHSKAARHR